MQQSAVKTPESYCTIRGSVTGGSSIVLTPSGCFQGLIQLNSDQASSYVSPSGQISII